jgi:hypothetical protein
VYGRAYGFERAARLLGLLVAAQSFGNLAASAIAGFLWTLISPAAAFVYAVGLDGDRGRAVGGSPSSGHGARRVIRHPGPSGR